MKPACNCLENICQQILEKKDDLGAVAAEFRDVNLFTGGLASYVDINNEKLTKSGRLIKKKVPVPVLHSFCAFCGKKYSGA